MRKNRILDYYPEGFPIVIENKKEAKKEEQSFLSEDHPAINFLFFSIWMCGIVIAPGWWKLLAFFPPYAFYLFFEKIMQYYGVI